MVNTERDCRIRKTDVIIPAFALILSAALILFILPAFADSSKGGTVVVYVDGEVYGSFSLSEDLDTVISGARGLNNHLIISKGEAYIADALCHDKICVHQGKIRYKGETIVFLPNKVVVEIKENEEGALDAVTR